MRKYKGNDFYYTIQIIDRSNVSATKLQSTVNSFLENFDLTLYKINKSKCQSIIMG